MDLPIQTQPILPCPRLSRTLGWISRRAGREKRTNTMSDDHVSSPPEDIAKNPSDGRWWIAALLVPIGCVGLGVLISFLVPPPKSAWIAGGKLLAIFSGVFVGAALCVVFAATSFLKHEKRRIWAVLAAMPCLVYIISSLVGFVRGMVQ